MRIKSLALAMLMGGATLGPVNDLSAQWRKPCCPPPSCCPAPSPCPPVQLGAPTEMPKVDQPVPPAPEQPPLVEPTFATEQAYAAGDYYAAVPNMLGDLGGGPTSIGFFYSNAAQQTRTDLAPFANLVNAKIAENNSPLPMNRVAFRYNFFHNAASTQAPADPVAVLPFSTVFLGTTTRQLDVHAFNFSVEKTFLADLCSVELRVPFFNTLNSNLNLAAGHVEGEPPVFAPGGTDPFGDTAAEFGDLTVILKGLLYYTGRVAVAGGMGIGIPTGSDSQVRINDFFSTQTIGFIDGTRSRHVRIDNETWNVSPYFAALFQPTDRLFVQGFGQLYLPIGSNRVAYSDNVTFFRTGERLNLVTTERDLSSQSLLMADIGVGYWLVRNPGGTLTGLAPTVELHYTTALEDADPVRLPRDEVFGPDFQQQPGPRVGNFSNRFDLLNVTLGATAEINQRLLIATGVALPLRDGDDRFFDWEFQLQVNYRFGAAPSYLPAGL